MLHHDRFNSANIHSFAVDRLSFPPITLNKITIFHTFIRLVDEINVAELIHTFGAVRNNNGDTNLESYAKYVLV